MTVAAVVVAAGAGLRASGAVPKQYQLIGGRPVLWWTLKAFCDHPRISYVQPVIGPGHEAMFSQAAGDLPVEPPVTGGVTRQDSCRIGIEALAGKNPDHVLVHDAARPFVSARLIDTIVGALEVNDGVIPGVPISDTVKQAPGGIVARTVDRTGLWAVQTPQGFVYGAIREAHRHARDQLLEGITDDAGIAEKAGLKVAVVPGEIDNRKLTTEADIIAADRRLLARSLTDIRVGQGIDVHGFEDGDHVVLCGVRIPHTHRLKGHSDADAALHALTDAILGAIGEGDIGTHFPPSDMRWKGAPSSIFLTKAMDLLRERRGIIGNADIAILCEAPRIAPHISAMKAHLAPLLSVSEDRIAIKATTTETLGFIGRKEGIAAFVTVTVRLPE
jgi:2-C-methyl-D-erythritol 4-phosphate cytidylyltransferase / 2-C-methyl-D-erythritol 2,4-cyclodiphosphate synthase